MQDYIRKITSEDFYIESLKTKSKTYGACIFSEPVSRFTYGFQLVKVVDGDTVDVSIDLGFGVWIRERLRLSYIDAPESRTSNVLEKKAGLQVKSFIEDKLSSGEFLLNTSKSNDKYGRFMATIFIDNVSLNQELVDLGYARVYHGEKKQPWLESELLKIVG